MIPRLIDTDRSEAVPHRSRPEANLIVRVANASLSPGWPGASELDVYTDRIYSPEAFEWDPAKRQANLRKHGVDFVAAVRIFEGPVLEREDRRRDYGEPRFVALGAVEELLLAVVYTPRRAVFRIISARRANRHEKAAYRQIQPAEA